MDKNLKEKLRETVKESNQITRKALTSPSSMGKLLTVKTLGEDEEGDEDNTDRGLTTVAEEI